MHYAAAPSIDLARPVPRWEHVYLVMLENREYHEIIGNTDAPSMNALAQQGAAAINTHDVADASFPNYLALTSGDTHFVTDNRRHDVDSPSLFDQLEVAGRS